MEPNTKSKRILTIPEWLGFSQIIRQPTCQQVSGLGAPPSLGLTKKCFCLKTVRVHQCADVQFLVSLNRIKLLLDAGDHDFHFCHLRCN